MEKPLAAAAGHRLAGQAHQSGQPRIRLLAVPRRDLHRSRRCRPTRPRPTIAAPAAPASTSARPHAFPAPYQLDARRCISYLTIEHKGPIPREFRAAIGNRIYGCDDCLAVCPWNKFASSAREAKLVARDDLASPPLAELAALDEAAFRKRFAGGPIKRIGHARFLRNVMIAIGNSGDRSLIDSRARCAGVAVGAGARRGGLGARAPLHGRGRAGARAKPNCARARRRCRGGMARGLSR